MHGLKQVRVRQDNIVRWIKISHGLNQPLVSHHPERSS